MVLLFVLMVKCKLMVNKELQLMMFIGIFYCLKHVHNAYI